MTRRKPRGLRPDEQELWQRITGNTIPLHNNPVQEALEHLNQKPQMPRSPDFRQGERVAPGSMSHKIMPEIGESLSNLPIQMNRRAYGKMKRGKLGPEGRIDLHGMTLARAHPVLNGFILNAQAQGKRLVLVITGKGRADKGTGPIPERHGVLRHQVPHWLATPPLAAMVMQVTPAHSKHGGSGAYYVYLRRQR